MERQNQLSFDFHGVTDHSPICMSASREECFPKLMLRQENLQRSNVIFFTPRLKSSAHTHSDLISRILKSVRFYG